MRISDWSADVCSSDLVPVGSGLRRWPEWTPFTYPFNLTQQPAASVPCGLTSRGLPAGLQIVGPCFGEIGSASCRERGGQYVSISVVAGSIKTQTRPLISQSRQHTDKRTAVESI